MLLYKYRFLLILTALILFLSFSCSTPQQGLEMENLLPQNISGWAPEDTTETYDRQTIFDYINGAGEVYLLYDYKNVITKRYQKQGNQDITVEIFDMSSPEDAFGIFSHSHEKDDSLVGQGSDFRGSFLCFWRDKYYVCVSAEKDDPVTSDVILEIAKSINSNIGVDGAKPVIIDLLPREGIRPNSIKYFHKYTSMNYHYYLSEKNILNLNESTEAVLAIYDPGRAHLLVAKYQTIEQTDSALKSFIDNYIPEAGESGIFMLKENKWVYASSYSNFLFIAFDMPSEERARELIERIENSFPR